MVFLNIVLVIIVVGILLWLVNSFIPMHPAIAKVLNIVVVICLLYWLFQQFHVIHFFAHHDLMPPKP